MVHARAQVDGLQEGSQLRHIGKAMLTEILAKATRTESSMNGAMGDSSIKGFS